MSKMEAVISKLPHPIRQCVIKGDLGGIQEIKLNTQQMIQNGLDRKTWENYLASATIGEQLIIEEFLRSSLSAKNARDN